jgi:lysyl-tRNA synthetase class 2
LYGRLISLGEDGRCVLRDARGEHRLSVQHAGDARAGDWVRVEADRLKVLTPNRARSLRWSDRVQDPRRKRAADIRTKTETGIREFFGARDFLETRTPLLVPCPGMEPHIRPFRVMSAAQGSAHPSAYLPTSPEFAMKRLLAGGLERIFQICSSFRDEPNAVTHLPEFTILEWYRACAGYEDIMRDTEELLESLARKIHGRPELVYQGQRIDVTAPWPRLRVRDLFREHAGIDLVAASDARSLSAHAERLGLGAALPGETWDDAYFKIWLNLIEPKLPADRAVLVTRYPASQAALSVIDADPDGSRWARRFEAYAGGLELGNAFEELTDPAEQRARFEKDMRLRAEIYGAEFPTNPLDESFLHALAEGIPPSGGIAVGVDRLVMLLADEPDIDYTVWLSARDLLSTS